MAIDKTRFEMLFIHANGIGFLAMAQLMAEIEATPVVEPTPAERAAAEADWKARMAEQEKAYLANPDATFPAWPEGVMPELPPMPPMDEAAIEKLLADEAVLVERTRLAREAIARGETPPDEPAEMPTDIPGFLAEAYAARGTMDEDVDAAYAKADLAAIEAALARLPTTLAPLTAPMAPDDFGRWVALYRAEDAQVDALVTAVRAAMPPVF